MDVGRWVPVNEPVHHPWDNVHGAITGRITRHRLRASESSLCRRMISQDTGVIQERSCGASGLCTQASDALAPPACEHSPGSLESSVRGGSPRTLTRPATLPMNDPEIPILDRVTVVLEKDRKWIGALGLSRSRFVDQFDTIMHHTSVKHDGDF